MIEIHQSFGVPSDPRTVWGIISDPRAVVGCVPGAALGGQQEDGSLDASVKVKFGPVNVTFEARVTLGLDDAAMVGHVTARGKDTQGGTRVTSTMTFEVRETPPLPAPPPRGGRESRPAEAESGSTVTIDGKVEISGRLAGMIESGASIVVNRMSSEFADSLTRRCDAEMSAITAREEDAG